MVRTLFLCTLHNSGVNPYPRTWVEVDLPALAFNLRLVRQAMDDPKVKIALVAKADAYGHGLVPTSRFALQNGADWIAVATVQEGIALRDAGIEKPIVVISPILAVEAEQAVFYRLRTLVERLEIAGALSHAAVDQDSTAIIHLEVETGLARFGAMPSEALDLACNIASLPGVKLEGLSTHFANSGRDPETTNLQLERFHRVLADCETAGLHFDVVHAANSAGAVRYPASRHDLVRIGLGAYGIEPYGLFEGVGKPVMTWKARVMALRDLPQGSPVSYSGTFTTSRRTVVATLGVGYGDGYPRALSNKGVVILNGVECPVIGLVCMDQVLVDATDLGSVTLGDEAILLGGQVPADRLSALIDTTPHEITTRIMTRVPRRYLFGTP